MVTKYSNNYRRDLWKQHHRDLYDKLEQQADHVNLKLFQEMQRPETWFPQLSEAKSTFLACTKTQWFLF